MSFVRWPLCNAVRTALLFRNAIWRCAVTVKVEPSAADVAAVCADIASGTDPYDATRKRGLTGSAMRRLAAKDAAVAQAYADAKLERQAKLTSYVGNRLVENVERAMQAVPVLDREGNEIGEWTYQGQVANRGLELLGREVGMFAEVSRVEVSGSLGGPVDLALLSRAERDELIANALAEPSVLELLPESYRRRVLELTEGEEG